MKLAEYIPGTWYQVHILGEEIISVAAFPPMNTLSHTRERPTDHRIIADGMSLTCSPLCLLPCLSGLCPLCGEDLCCFVSCVHV